MTKRELERLLLTRHEAAACLGISVGTLDGIRRAGKLCDVRIGRSLVGICRSELRRFIKSQESGIAKSGFEPMGQCFTCGHPVTEQCPDSEHGEHGYRCTACGEFWQARQGCENKGSVRQGETHSTDESTTWS